LAYCRVPSNDFDVDASTSRDSSFSVNIPALLTAITRACV
jgi:hypothetical protein